MVMRTGTLKTDSAPQVHAAVRAETQARFSAPAFVITNRHHFHFLNAACASVCVLLSKRLRIKHTFTSPWTWFFIKRRCRCARWQIGLENSEAWPVLSRARRGAGENTAGKLWKACRYVNIPRGGVSINTAMLLLNYMQTNRCHCWCRCNSGGYIRNHPTTDWPRGQWTVDRTC